MLEQIIFDGVSCSHAFDDWREEEKRFLFDFGDGDLCDKDGDDYFIHLEYRTDNNQWIEEVWFDDDYLAFGEWTGAKNQMRNELNEIELMMVNVYNLR